MATRFSDTHTDRPTRRLRRAWKKGAARLAILLPGGGWSELKKRQQRDNMKLTISRTSAVQTMSGSANHYYYPFRLHARRRQEYFAFAGCYTIGWFCVLVVQEEVRVGAE